MSRQRVAAITGSASGIGAATRARLEAEGWRVIGVDLTGQEVDADLSTPEGRAQACAEVIEASDGRLDGLVPGAGVGPTEPKGSIVAANFFGAMAVLDGLFDTLRQGEQPAAVLICSNSISLIPVKDPTLLDLMLAGHEAAAVAASDGFDGSTIYALTKSALARAARSRAQAWGEAGVRLNLVAPGPVRTPLLQATRDDPELGPYVDLLPIPRGHEAEPSEIAGPVVFLLGPDAANIHGSLLFADGGTDALLRPDHV